MKDNNNSGKHRHWTPLPLDNPDRTPKKDWWDEMCSKAGEVNHWDKKAMPKNMNKKRPNKHDD